MPPQAHDPQLEPLEPQAALIPPTFSLFLTFQDHGRYYMVQRGFPHYLGQIIRGDGSGTQVPDGPQVPHGTLCLCQVTGYDIYIVFAGALAGNRIVIESNWRQRIEDVTIAMANFYLLERIAPDPGKFKRQKLIYT